MGNECCPFCAGLDSSLPLGATCLHSPTPTPPPPSLKRGTVRDNPSPPDEDLTRRSSARCPPRGGVPGSRRRPVVRARTRERRRPRRIPRTGQHGVREPRLHQVANRPEEREAQPVLLEALCLELGLLRVRHRPRLPPGRRRSVLGAVVAGRQEAEVPGLPRRRSALELLRRVATVNAARA